MIMQNIVNTIFLSLSATVINLVPALYSVFYFIAGIEVVSYDIIHSVWNNLYIILSVIILFAIAIKLINAIVNPDVLTDNKKGVKKAFLNAVISVFLIAFLPFVFSALRDVQVKILKDNIIPRFIFGNDSDQSGNTLAWVAISSCIDLEAFDELDITADLELEKNSETGIYMPTNTDQNPKWVLTKLSILRPWNNFVVSELIDNYVDFHPVVLFIFLVVLIYELLVLVLDTSLRAFKLALLQMMTPIVLGAYVFKSDILKNWALEYIKTFLQIFLLIFALCFMEFLIPIVTNLIDIDGYFHLPRTFMIIGLIRMLLYIGVLRLVKQIGPLINKIFGTNIQAKGGIKGRLGEMAAVGGLAQKAWGALGTGAKNIGKLALSAPFAGAGYAANRMYKNQTGKNLTDHKAVRGVRAGLSGISTAFKTGSLVKASEAANATYDKTTASAVDKARMSQRISDNIDNILTDGNAQQESAIKDTNIARKKAANAKLKNDINRIGGTNVKNAHDKYESATRAESIAKGVDKANKSITDNLTAAMNQYSEGDSRRNEIYAALKEYQDSGNLTELANFIAGNKDIIKNANIIKNLVGENGSLNTKKRLLEYARQNQSQLELSGADLDNLGRGENAVSFLASTTLKGRTESAKKKLDVEILGARLSELDKMELEDKISANLDLVNSLPFAIGRKDSENTLERGKIGGAYYDFGSLTQSSPQSGPSSTSQTTSTTQSTPTNVAGDSGNENNSGSNSPQNSGSTIINNNYNSSTDSGNSSGAQGNGNSAGSNSSGPSEVKVTNFDEIKSSLNEAAGNISDSISKEGQSIRQDFRTELGKTTKAVDNIVDKIDDLKPPKDNE